MLSVTLAVSRSMAWTRQTLFTPFDLGKWFALGFCAFLAGLTGGGAGGQFPTRPGGWGSHAGGAAEDLLRDGKAFVSSHVALVVVLVAAAVVLILALGALLQWLSSRGQFMFLDGVCHNRALVAEPWRRFRTLGNSLFLFQFLLGLAAFGVFLLLLALGVRLAWADLVAESFGRPALLALAICVPLLLLFALAMVLVGQVIKDFVVPIMARREIPAMQAVTVFYRELLPGQGGSLALFYLLKLGLAAAAGTLMLIVGCCTCCLGFIPYLSSVLFLPVLVFFRGYSLFLLEQFGEEWRLVDPLN